MRKYLNSSLFVVIILSLLASLPLIRQAGLPNGSDVLYHTYRVGEMARSWDHGMPFPRWAEGLYYGYGSPLWHFYASLTYYITTTFVRYLSLSALDALRLLLVLCFVGMGTFTYAFMHQQVNRLAGVLSAIAYLYSPYLLFTEPYARGTYPEILAFTLFPLVMWRFATVLRRPNGINLASASMALFLLAISHNLMAIVLTLVLVGWLVWNGVATLLADRSAWQQTLRPYALASLGCVTGLGLSGYFWIPLILESNTVNLQNLTGVSLLDYRNFFVPFAKLLQPMPLNDLGAINGLRNVSVLGVGQWLGALIGLIGIVMLTYRALRAGHHDDRVLRQGYYFAGVAVLFIFFIGPVSSPLWDAVRPLQYLQFPWRLFGAVAFCLSVLVGMNALWLVRLPKRVGAVLSGGMVLLLVALGIPSFTVPEWTNTQVDTSISAYHQSEVTGLQRGTTFTDEYRPHTVFTLPDAVPSLLADYADGYPINKAHVPEGVVAAPLQNSPVWLEWLVNTPQDFQMEVYTFYWEGWRAVVDNQPVDITPSLEHGFITFPVPKGSHDVRVYLGTTPARIFGDMFSAISLAVLLAMVAIRINNHRTFGVINDEPPPSRTLRWALVVGAGVAIGLALWNPEGIFWLNSPPSTSPSAHVVHFDLGDDFRVIGYDVNNTTFQAGDRVELTVYWYPRQESSINFSSFVHIGVLGTPPLAQEDKLHPADRIISQWWKPTGYLYDAYTIQLPNDMPAGEYDVMVGMYTCELMPKDACGNGYRPPVTDANGTLLGDVVPLLKITVK